MTAAVFNTYFNGKLVRVSVGEGESFELAFSRETEEGYEWKSDKYYLEGEYVFNDVNSGGRDCDGIIQSGCLLKCHLSRLEAGNKHESGVKYPAWEAVEDYPVYDQYAQMAAY